MNFAVYLQYYEMRIEFEPNFYAVSSYKASVKVINSIVSLSLRQRVWLLTNARTVKSML